MCQIWCQSLQPFGIFPILLNCLPPKSPQNAPWGFDGLIVFSIYSQIYTHRADKICVPYFMCCAVLEENDRRGWWTMTHRRHSHRAKWRQPGRDTKLVLVLMLMHCLRISGFDNIMIGDTRQKQPSQCEIVLCHDVLLTLRIL